MYAAQAPYRDLYESLLEYQGDHTFQEVLVPWLGRHEEERRFLQAFAARPSDPWPAASDEELCRLYAASRVNELLLLRFQAPPDGSARWAGPPLVLEEYVAFATRLGFQVEPPARFHPFFHEIVGAVSSADAQEPVQIVAEHWPALMLGDLLFSRAGCSVRASPGALDARRATSSTLYWAHRRSHRPTQDLSVGWGGNSQWRTRFRRDYRSGGRLHFNVDGELEAAEADAGANPNPAREGLTAAQRIELLTHRCFVRTLLPEDDLWPWDDRHSTAQVAS